MSKTNTVKAVRCPSGIIGWQTKLQNNYGGVLQAWLAYAEMYGLHLRLGFTTPQEAWDANPTISGSVIPADFRIIKPPQ